MKIRYVPFEELDVHEVLEQDNATFFEDFARQNITPQGYKIPSVNWIDGVAFVVLVMPPTEDIVKEQLVGRVHYSTVIFTRMQFQPEVNAQVGKELYPVRLRKAANNPTFVELVKFLKEFKPS